MKLDEAVKTLGTWRDATGFPLLKIAIRTVLPEVERLRADLGKREEEIRFLRGEKPLRVRALEARIEAALAEIRRTRAVPRPMRGSIATANRIEKALKGKEGK